MAIEFRCSQCNKLLRTADDTAGKKAKCPECGAVMTIPEAPAMPVGSSFVGAGAPRSFPPDTGNPYQSPQLPIGSRLPISQAKLDFSDAFSRTWEIFKQEWGICLGAVLIAFGLNAAVYVAAVLVNLCIPLLGSLIIFVFSTWIGIGLALFMLKKARGQDAAIGEIFNGAPYLGKVILAKLLVLAIVLGIALVCVGLPVLIGLAISEEAAIVLAVLGTLVAIVAICFVQLVISQFLYLILDRNAGVIESFTMSRDLMQGNKLTLLLIWLIGGVAGNLLVLMTCGLGVFAVVPYFCLLTPVVYLTVTSQPTAEQLGAGRDNPFGSLPRMGPVQ